MDILRSRIVIAVAASLALSAPACVSSAPQPNGSSEHDAARASADPTAGADDTGEARGSLPNEDPDSTFTSTIVHVTPDGRREVFTTTITLAEEVEEREQAKAQTGYPVRGYDSGCAASSEWLYDRAGQVGNRICFDHIAGTPFVYDLYGYVRSITLCGSIARYQYWWGDDYSCVGGSWTKVTLVPYGHVKSIWTSSSPAANHTTGVGLGRYSTGYDAWYGSYMVAAQRIDTPNSEPYRYAYIDTSF